MNHELDFPPVLFFLLPVLTCNYFTTVIVLCTLLFIGGKIQHQKLALSWRLQREEPEGRRRREGEVKDRLQVLSRRTTNHY